MDITMCKGEGCPIKSVCKRFNAEPGMMQSWFVETPGKYDIYESSDTVLHKEYQKVWRCDMYWGEQQDNIMDILQVATKNES